MKAEIFNNLLNRNGVLCSSDMTSEEKKNFFSYMVSRGSTEAFAYDRFFKEGFSEWELCGIDKIKSEFLRDYQEDLLTGEPVKAQEDGTEDTGSENDREYPSILAIQNDEPGGFYRCISRSRGLIGKFKALMLTMGMGDTTVWKRFSADNWKEFERVGIRKIIEDYLKLQKNK